MKVHHEVEIVISDLKRLDEDFFRGAILQLEACNVELAAP